ncbi:MAG: 50S ribosome-binding GTPase [Phycisphaerales bacterium]|nr:50S ribosome-binding GTPase [Phycisphaerales bacterium]
MTTEPPPPQTAPARGAGDPPGVGCSWRLCSPAERPGAIAVLQLRGDVDGALERLGIAPVPVGQVRLRDLVGVDRGVVSRVRTDLAILTPHAGQEILRQLGAAFSRAGVVLDRDDSVRGRFPEAASDFEAAQLEAIARAASPRAIDLLLAQPRLWSEHLGRPPTLGEEDPDPGRSARLGRLITPPMVVAVGESNIGKSTLLNRLSGRAVAAVADEPGTTRDHVGSLVDLDGLIVRWVDTPGRRAGAPEAEREALAIANALLPQADLIVRLGDRDTPPVELPPGVSAPSLAVALRADRGRPAWGHDASVSAATGEGIAGLGVCLRRGLLPDADLSSGAPWRFWG